MWDQLHWVVALKLKSLHTFAKAFYAIIFIITFCWELNCIVCFFVAWVVRLLSVAMSCINDVVAIHNACFDTTWLHCGMVTSWNLKKCLSRTSTEAWLRKELLTEQMIFGVWFPKVHEIWLTIDENCILQSHFKSVSFDKVIGYVTISLLSIKCN